MKMKVFIIIRQMAKRERNLVSIKLIKIRSIILKNVKYKKINLIVIIFILTK